MEIIIEKINLFWLCHQFQAKLRTGRSWSTINVLSAVLELSNTVMHIGRRQEKGCIAKAKVTNLPFLTSLLFSFLFQRSRVSLNVPVSSHKPTHTPHTHKHSKGSRHPALSPQVTFVIMALNWPTLQLSTIYCSHLIPTCVYTLSLYTFVFG